VETKADPPPPAEKINASLAGFGNLNGQKVAFLAIQPKDAKNGMEYYTLGEGESAPDGYDLKVVSVDEENETVKVLNNGQEVAMNFKDNALKGGGGPPVPAPGQPGFIPGANPNLPRAIPINGQPPPGAAGMGGGPTIIGRGGQVYGGNPPPLNAAATLQPTVSPNNLLLNNGVGAGSFGAASQPIPQRVPRDIVNPINTDAPGNASNPQQQTVIPRHPGEAPPAPPLPPGAN
jgi:hypothetical protein